MGTEGPAREPCWSKRSTRLWPSGRRKVRSIPEGGGDFPESRQDIQNRIFGHWGPRPKRTLVPKCCFSWGTPRQSYVESANLIVNNLSFRCAGSYFQQPSENRGKLLQQRLESAGKPFQHCDRFRTKCAQTEKAPKAPKRYKISSPDPAPEKGKIAEQVRKLLTHCNFHTFFVVFGAGSGEGILHFFGNFGALSV